MSDKGPEGSDKMSVDFVIESKRMADAIMRKAHRGPGDTVDAAMHRAERLYGAPAAWLHRLRYRYLDLNDVPASVFFSIFKAYRAVCEAGEQAYSAERNEADESNSILVSLADFVAGKEASSEAASK